MNIYINIVWLMSFALFSCHGAKSSSSQKEDVFTTSGNGRVEIVCYRHASICVVYNGYAIQIDPVTDKAHGIVFDKEKKADAILVTHSHDDHFDPKAIAELSSDSTVVVLNGDAQRLLGRGIALKNGECYTLPCGVKVEAVAAYNTTPERMKFHPRMRDNGYILNIENLRIYIAGDTEVIPEMKNLGHIDIAFMPCNLPYTMTPAQIEEAAKIVAPHILFPYHFGNTDLSDIPAKMKRIGIETRIRDMQ